MFTFDKAHFTGSSSPLLVLPCTHLSDFQAFGGDLYLLCKLLLAKQDKRVYHLRDKQVIKLLAKLIPGTTLEELSIDLEKGDQSETGRKVHQALNC
jgi:hypothetical protein